MYLKREIAHFLSRVWVSDFLSLDTLLCYLTLTCVESSTLPSSHIVNPPDQLLQCEQ